MMEFFYVSKSSIDIERRKTGFSTLPSLKFDFMWLIVDDEIAMINKKKKMLLKTKSNIV
jgi:hypothetical protein